MYHACVDHARASTIYFNELCLTTIVVSMHVYFPYIARKLPTTRVFYYIRHNEKKIAGCQTQRMVQNNTVVWKPGFR